VSGTLDGKRILLIIAGGIAAYKSLDLIRRLRERGARVRCILTKGGAQFITPLSVSSLSGNKVYSDLFSLTDEAEMGHIRLSREADLVVVAPATADLMAKMAAGLAGDLASTALLATDKPVMIAPAMNVQMWRAPATRRNVEILESRGVLRVGPEAGDLACGEEGEGRLAEVEAITAAIEHFFAADAPLAGRHALVTAGPTVEAIDPVRYLANRSSGKQGYGVAAALAALGARTTLITGPTALADPPGVAVTRVESARDMLAASLAALPADIAVCVAAVCDWRVAQTADHKMKKTGGRPPAFELVENPDILATLAGRKADRPALVVGFAAETRDVLDNARAKRRAKGCDWIVANDVGEESGVMGGENNAVHLIRPEGEESWPHSPKADISRRLAQCIADHFQSSAS
jgi:phosphopantothenoylcysteine decarboxylase/phosphopantothenate--cysteine ligase